MLMLTLCVCKVCKQRDILLAWLLVQVPSACVLCLDCAGFTNCGVFVVLGRWGMHIMKCVVVRYAAPVMFGASFVVCARAPACVCACVTCFDEIISHVLRSA